MSGCGLYHAKEVNMQREIRDDKIQDFISGLKEQGITKVVCAGTNELRPKQVEDNMLSVVSCRRVEMLAYRDATIFKCIIEDIDSSKAREILESQGFEVSVRSRNIT